MILITVTIPVGWRLGSPYYNHSKSARSTALTKKNNETNFCSAWHL